MAERCVLSRGSRRDPQKRAVREEKSSLVSPDPNQGPILDPSFKGCAPVKNKSGAS